MLPSCSSSATSALGDGTAYRMRLFRVHPVGFLAMATIQFHQLSLCWRQKRCLPLGPGTR